ncbi:hypothetical protein GALL_544300 [mine drainage metagenome]|uniref:Uncharacterized protein n=1 Tax=mine drainage metagenome TaxID=410659 RepID=A0A1J5P0F2_9ZZZZ
MLEAVLRRLERGRQVEDLLAVLDGHDPADREGAAIADPLDLQQDRNLRIAGADEIGMQRVAVAALDRAIGRRQGLGHHLAAIDPATVGIGGVAPVHVELELLEVQNGQEFVGLIHGQNLTCGMSRSRGSSLSLSEVIAWSGSTPQSMARSGSFQITPPSVCGA